MPGATRAAERQSTPPARLPCRVPGRPGRSGLPFRIRSTPCPVRSASHATRVKDTYPGAPGVVVAGTLRRGYLANEVLFAAADGNDGLQVWISNGTAIGTHQVGKIGALAGSGAADIGELYAWGSALWFAANDGVTGIEPWWTLISDTVARVSAYGAGCSSTGTLVPSISGVCVPQIGNAGFAIAVDSGVPSRCPAGGTGDRGRRAMRRRRTQGDG